MPIIEKKFIVTSLQHPEKVYTSSEEFWDDHPGTAAGTAVNAAYTKAGKIVAETSTLNEGGMSVTYTKTYASEKAWTEYTSDNEDAIAEGAAVCSFAKVTPRSSILIPA